MSVQPALYADLKKQSARDVRAAIRAGAYAGHTAGLAPGKLQCNLAILPERYALDFLRFCQRNPKPCPVVGVSDTGDAMLPTLGDDIDIRTDVPRYRVFRDGQLADEVTDISDLWADDLVTVALGCSFTFENALVRSGIPVRHLEAGRNVPMYRSNIALNPAGPFGGEMVITMRPVAEDRVRDAYAISAKYPQAHGAPIGQGDPATVGIRDLDAPEWGEPVEVRDGEVPLYWACGVTPQNVLLAAKLPFVITHSPGHMLIADVAEDAETTIYKP
ncbi:putative hydro-lyase [Sulfitobacter albidus]|uniref:Putative hydro-lyase KDD17_13195 n=1 Tax=Sulfitobacter albidus TaxID=2829501 RepID=A0A975JCL7_9RHOB|nr:putative hydro-lyase [Sulfitobacter albidus]QUJ75882.1 putative hydro-lyase [Sulfitobacter albidus]